MAKRKKRSLSAQSLLLAVFFLVVFAAAGMYFSGLNPETLEFEAPGPHVDAPGVTTAKPTETPGRVHGRLFVTVLDVGKADSIVVLTPNDHAMLIDSGEKNAFPVIQEALERMGIKELDVIVATHPHSDHIGSMKKVIENYKVGAVYTPKISAETATYEGFVKAMNAKSLKPKEAKAGVTISFDKDVKVEVLAPLNYNYDNMNNCSAVLKVTFGQTSFLFAADAEKESEDDMIKAYTNGELAADVLKVGHHGSITSSTNRFLSAVRPSIAAISTAPEANSSTPHKDVFERLANLKCEVLRTDRDGTITLISDGKSVKHQ